jgi:hypothetical protein
MLTTLFYYDHYRPYIVREADGVSGDVNRRPASASAPGKPILLNKSLNGAFLSYARGAGASVVSIKESAKGAVYAMDKYDEREFNGGGNHAKGYLEEALKYFASAYNGAAAFRESQAAVSPGLAEFYDGVSGGVYESAAPLKSLGLTSGSGGVLEYDPAVIESVGPGEARLVMSAARGVFEKIYNGAVNVMKKPLADHMEFKSYRYYYNYSRGITKEETFNGIGSGMMVDIAL